MIGAVAVLGVLAALCPLPANGHTSAPQGKKIPASLVDVGEFGENIYDFARAKEWDKVFDKHKALAEAAKQLAKDLKEPADTLKKLETTVKALGNAISGKDLKKTLIEANQVTLLAADLIEPFEPQVPAAVTRLDYYGRELQIWTDAKDLEKLKATGETMRKTWDKLRDSVKTKGGVAEAKKFDELMAKVAAAKTVEDYGPVVQPILDEVDHLEMVFKKK
jgi:hypothetical protein